MKQYQPNKILQLLKKVSLFEELSLVLILVNFILIIDNNHEKFVLKRLL